MSNSYTSKYEILKSFKEDKYQNVLIGSNRENADEVVVINIFHKNEISKVISKSQFPNGLNNLLHLEEDQNDLVVITEYQEGTPLESYLEFFDTTVKHKINLAYEYMSKIVKYDSFSNSIKSILIDESQVIFKDKELYFNELLFLDEVFSKPVEFNAIALKLATMIEKIVFSKDPTDDQDNDRASEAILGFINKLKSNEHTFQSIEDVYNEFRKIYIYDLFMEEEDGVQEGGDDNNNLLIADDPLNGESDVLNTDFTNEDGVDNDSNDIFIDDEEIIFKTENRGEEKRRFTKYGPIIAIGVVVIAILLYVSLDFDKLTFNPLNEKNQSESIKLEAHFLLEKVNDLYYFTEMSKVHGKDNSILKRDWEILKGDTVIRNIADKKSLKIQFDNEGEYKVILRIKDKYGNTDEYSENIVYRKKLEIDELKNSMGLKEKLNNLNLRYSDKTIVKDYRAFRSGNYSLKLGEEGKVNSETLVVDNIDVENKPIFSMWIASNSRENISISIKGYKNKRLQFQKPMSFMVKEANIWEMVKLNEITEDVDMIEIIFNNFSSPIWIDDIEISSYK
ncbi:MAG: hypothetical protein MJA82_02365 [Clostridia bacterium]|nr:hypothetical protein [Clostridia bacterium]